MVARWMQSQVRELRSLATRYRNAYQKDYMGKPCRHMADAFDDAATLIESRIQTAEQGEQGGSVT